MLDQKLQFFFEDCKSKTEILTKEILSLKSENSELKKLVLENERENRSIKSVKDKTQTTFDHLTNLNTDLKDQVSQLKSQITQAHNDLCNITKAYQLQKLHINTEENSLKQSVQSLNLNQKGRLSSFSESCKTLDSQIQDLKNLIASKSKQNSSIRLEILEKDLRDSHRVSSIRDLKQKVSSI